LLAFEALGLARIDALPATLGTTYFPDDERHAMYSKAMQRQQRLYAALIGDA
jgi:hypothetical protein